MPKGDLTPSEKSTTRDPRTGAVVHQITNHSSINHPTYFLTSSFTRGQKAILFTSYRTGQAQLFEAFYPDGPIRQLTDGAAIHPFSAILGPANEVFFVRGGQVWSLDRDTLEERKVAEYDGQLGECSLSRDGEWFVAACRRPDSWGLAVGRTDGALRDFIAFPRTIIHPQFCPVDPDWIEFAADPAHADAPRLSRRFGPGMPLRARQRRIRRP
ncbi:MAG: hypothetical protein R2748_19515 [Bryobacterales bacterium]